MPDFQDLPYVNDDLKNMKIAVQMLNFPKENVFEFLNVTYDKIKAFFAAFLLHFPHSLVIGTLTQYTFCVCMQVNE